MKTIFLKHPYNPAQIGNQPVVLALGFFDGLHLGHQEVIRKAKEISQEQGLNLAVLTFNHTPKLIYQKIHPWHYTYLTILERKQELMAALGVDILYVAEFTWDLGHLLPQEFVDSYIVGLKAQAVVAGFDYTYGPKEIANMQTLIQHSQGRFSVTEISEKRLHQHKIGATSIRDYLEKGLMQEANRELGYIYQTSGLVINGLKRGRTIGYPTANVALDHGQVIPGIGVYVVEFWVQGHWYQGMASIGYNITFNDVSDLSVEVYILDFDRMIYGEAVKINWHHYLRPEAKFDGIPALIDQLDADRLATQEYFAVLNK